MIYDMNRFLIRFALLAATFMALYGCENLYVENMDECYDGVSVTLNIDPSVSDATLAAQTAQSAVIYVFDSEGNFLERRETQLGQIELLSHKDAGSIKVVGWVNLSGDIYDITQLDEAMIRQQGLAALKVLTGVETYHTPTDLFYGETELQNANPSFDVEHKDIYATRRTGQATVTVRGLKDYAGVQDNDFYIVTKATGSAMDFFGNFASHSATHVPAMSGFNKDGEFLTGNFNLHPTAGTPMTVEIWHRTLGLIYSTTTHQTGEDIHIVNDRTTNILIDFTMGISIRIEQTLWGVAYSWKVFN